MGVEHPQYLAIERLYVTANVGGIDPVWISPNKKTPNQLVLAAGLRLGASRIWPQKYPRQAALDQARSLFARMDACGHQATGVTYGDEQGAPAPHDELWSVGMGVVLSESRLSSDEYLIAKSIGYWGDHVSMCREFWTPAGVRIACSRAKAPAGMILRPNWPTSSRIYSEMTGETLPKEPHDRLALRILRDQSALWPRIIACSARVAPLVLPIRKWRRAGGGFVAAFTKDVPMNDRMSWLVVDGSGAILDAGRDLADFVEPDGPPDVVYGGSPAPPAPVIPSFVEPPVDPTGPVSDGRIQERTRPWWRFW